MSKADVIKLFLQCRVVIMASVPVFLNMAEQDLAGLNPPGQCHGFLNGVEGFPGYVILPIMETMFEPVFKDPRLNHQQVSPLDLLPLLWKRFDVTQGVHNFLVFLFKYVYKGYLRSTVHRNGRDIDFPDLYSLPIRRAFHKTLFFVKIDQRAVHGANAAQAVVQLFGQDQPDLFVRVGPPCTEIQGDLLHDTQAFHMIRIQVR